jgi:hypothetical protein
MSLDSLRRRLDRIERDTGNSSAVGRQPAVRIITYSDKDRDQQLAALTAAGEYEPDRPLIERRIVDPPPESAARAAPGSPTGSIVPSALP